MNTHCVVASRLLARACICAAVLALHGCGGSDGMRADVDPIVLAAAAQPPSAQCANGGVQLQAGFDINSNGVLDADETLGAHYACGVASAKTATLVVASFEPPGSECANGGVRVRSGTDVNANGALDADEVSATSHACHAAPPAATTVAGPNTLARLERIGAGSTCAFGGIDVAWSSDANGNGMLQPGQATSVRALCEGSLGANAVWTPVAGAAAQAAANTGYTARSDTVAAAITLPANLNVGDLIAVRGSGAGGWSIVQNGGQSINAQSLGIVAGETWTPQESARGWGAVAATPDGARLIIGASGQTLFVSSDAGHTFTPTGTIGSWFDTATSADGTKLAAVGEDAPIYTSADAGITWTAHPGTKGEWIAIASSADASRLVAAQWAGPIFVSADGGDTWSQAAPSRTYSALASSADGTSLVASVDGGYLYVSHDAGATWSAVASEQPWDSLCMSADGRKLLAAAYGGYLYASVDGGASWTAMESVRNWTGTAVSDDGNTMVALDDFGLVYVSHDGGSTWSSHDSPRDWAWAASSADGSRLVAVEFGGRIYTSSTWTTIGSEGGLSGGPNDAVELQYLGNGNFAVVQHAGTVAVR
jgi:hypothetical protein